MSTSKTRADYEQLTVISRLFAQQAEACSRMTDALGNQKSVLEGGDWVGTGATAFFGEMNGAILPALKRLGTSLTHAAESVQRICREVKSAEEAAARILNGDATAVVASNSVPEHSGVSRFGNFGFAADAGGSGGSGESSSNGAESEGLGAIALRALERVNSMHEAATKTVEFVTKVSGQIENMEVELKLLKQAQDQLGTSGERLEKINKLSREIQAYKEILDKASESSKAQQEYMDNPDDLEKGVAWANSTADFMAATGHIARTVGGPVGAAAEKLLATVPSVVKAVTNDLSNHIKKIDKAMEAESSASGPTESWFDVKWTGAHYVNDDIARSIDRLPISREEKRQIYINSERLGSLERAIAMSPYGSTIGQFSKQLDRLKEQLGME